MCAVLSPRRLGGRTAPQKLSTTLLFNLGDASDALYAVLCLVTFPAAALRRSRWRKAISSCRLGAVGLGKHTHTTHLCSHNFSIGG